MKSVLVPFAVLALLAGVVACSDAEEDYCETLSTEQKELTELADGASGESLAPTMEVFERLQEAAPEELRDEWDTVVGAYDVLVETIEELDVDPAGYDPKDPPAGVSDSEARRLAAVAGALRSTRVLDAVQGIEDHARSVCDVDFSA